MFGMANEQKKVDKQVTHKVDESIQSVLTAHEDVSDKLTEEFQEWLEEQGMSGKTFHMLPYEHQVEYLLAYDLV